MESIHSQPSDNDQSANPPAASQPPAAARKKTTILDLARYRLGQRAYWIVFRSERDPDFQRPAEWLQGEHPWTLWRYKMMPWTVPMKPPRAHPADTMAIMMLCSEKPRIEPFRISEIVRSENSGTFLYTGPNGMVMPEGLLFPTRKAAQREIARMAKMFAAWTSTWEEAATNPPTKE